MVKRKKPSLEDRVAALEEKLRSKEGCCDAPAEPVVRLASQFRAVAVGKPSRFKISDGLFVCAQVHELPSLKKKGVRHQVATSWIETKEGKQVGKKTCSCTSGSCSLSKTCDGGIDVFCDCVRCTLSCS